MKIKKILTVMSTLSLLALPTTGLTQSAWPERSAKIISPYGPGGPNDLSARLLGEQLSKELGQSFIVENKAGAGTAIGNLYAAKAANDGYTLLYAAAPYSTLEALNEKLAYDPRADLKAVSMTASVPLFLIVNADSPIKNVEDLIALGKADSKGLTLGSPGHGSLPHLAMELLLRDAQVPGVIVQYKGDMPAYTDLLAGRLDATLTAITAALPHIKAGKLRVLGVASEQSSDIYPDAQPLKEQGLPNVVASGWYGFMVPSQTSEQIVDKLDQTLNKILNNPQVRAQLIAQGMDPQALNQQEFAAFIDTEMNKWADVIRQANIKAE